jgi:hypothetical protein
MLSNKLSPHLVEARDENGNKRTDTIPEWLAVAKEQTWPDMWVNDYTKSVVLTIKGDVRCAPSPLSACSHHTSVSSLSCPSQPCGLQRH